MRGKLTGGGTGPGDPDLLTLKAIRAIEGADVTLVGRADGYGLVISGTAGDTPRTLLRADQLESAVATRQG